MKYIGPKKVIKMDLMRAKINKKCDESSVSEKNKYKMVG